MHRQDLGLYSRPEELLGNGVRAHVNCKGKVPFTGCSEEDRTGEAASHRTASPNALPTELFGRMGRVAALCIACIEHACVGSRDLIHVVKVSR